MLKREYQKVIAEEILLSPELRLDILTKLAMRRYFASGSKWNHHMNSEERALRIKERMFITRHPKQENYLNQVGYERAMFWEQALAQMSES